jgi:hypothetical protein
MRRECGLKGDLECHFSLYGGKKSIRFTHTTIILTSLTTLNRVGNVASFGCKVQFLAHQKKCKPFILKKLERVNGIEPSCL